MVGHDKNIIAGPKMGEECYFPFEYKGNLHYTCITEDSTSGPWCATTSEFSDDMFGYCDCPYKGNCRSNNAVYHIGI